MTPQLTAEQVEHNGSTILAVSGEIDLATAPELERQLIESIEADVTTVDLTDVGFIDSTGLRALLTANESAQAAGKTMVLIVAEGPVTKLFTITGVDSIFTLADSRDSAVSGA